MVLLASCVCPVFSFIERKTGLEVSTGDQSDTGFIEDELIYPGSRMLVEVTGDVDEIISAAGEIGLNVSQKEQILLGSLPDDVKKEEITAVIYYTSDSKKDVRYYYLSLEDKGWTASSYESGDSTSSSTLFFMFKGDREQPVLINSSGNRRFIIFIDYDWDSLEEG